MDKELDGITPTNLDGTTVVNTVQRASQDEINKAAEEAKSKKQDYYVDPLEQEALMQEKIARMNAEKAREQGKTVEEIEEENNASDEDVIRPDMNVNGFFSTGNTASKQSFINGPASKGTLRFCFICGILCGTYSVIYLALLIATTFDLFWFLSWVYGAVVLVAITIMISSIRSLKVQKEDLKRNAMVGLIGSIITMIPIVAWFIHWIIQII